MAKRTGLVTMIFLLERICRFLVRYRSSIAEQTGDHAGLSDLFDTLLSVCEEIVSILTLYRQTAP